MAKTTIQVEEETRHDLIDVGKKSETFDDVIQRLLVESGHKKKNEKEVPSVT